MTVIEDMLYDTRPIECLSYIGEKTRAAVGRDAITYIVPYREPGQKGYVTYFAVYQGDFLWQRIPAHAVVVQYKGGRNRAKTDPDL